MERERSRPDSGVVPVAGPATETASEISGACHAIIDAAASAIVNLEFAAIDIDEEKRAAIDDAQRAVSRIVELAKAIRRLHRNG